MIGSLGALIFLSGVVCLIAGLFLRMQKGNQKKSTNLLLIGGAFLLIGFSICSTHLQH